MALKYDTREVTHGIERGFYAEIIQSEQGDYSFDKPKAFTGARAANIETSQENTTYYADNQAHIVLAGAKTTTGSVTLYQIPKNFLVNHLGKDIDKNGALLDTGKYKNFVFGYITLVDNENGEQTEELHIYYNTKASAYAKSAAADEDAVSPLELEIPLTMSPSQFVKNKEGKAVTEITLRKTKENAAIFANIFDTVYMPQFEA